MYNAFVQWLNIAFFVSILSFLVDAKTLPFYPLANEVVEGMLFSSHLSVHCLSVHSKRLSFFGMYNLEDA